MKDLTIARVAAVCFLVGCATTSLAQQKRPAAASLLPENTAVFLQIANAGELVDRFQQTAIGRIGKDRAIYPIFADLYNSANERFAPAAERLGLSLDELLRIPQGEVAAAMIPVRDGRPALAVIIDAGDQMGALHKLIERSEQSLAERGATRTVERVNDIELVIQAVGARRFEELAYFKNDERFVVATNAEVAREILGRLSREADKTGKSLAEKEEFRTIMKHCDVTSTHQPQAAFFTDPLLVANAVTQGNFAAQTALALAPALGIDGIKGMGGSITMAEDGFDAVTHLHLLLDDPRAGVVEMLAMKSGETEPESWVPRDAASYTTVHWDVEKTYVTLGDLFDSFQGEGALEDAVNRRLSGPLDLDFKDDILSLLEGRFTWVTWMQRPARLNSRANLVGAKLRDAKAFRATLEKTAERFSDRVETKTMSGVVYYLGEPPARRNRPEGEQDNRPNMRRPSPCIAVLDDYLLITDSELLLHEAIRARGDEKRQLRSEEDYRQIAETIRRSPGGKSPGMVTFSRPEEGFKLLYDLLSSDETQQRIARRGESNSFFAALGRALSKNPLPPFEVLKRYLAPGGGLITSDKSGFHYTGFTLLPE